MKKGREMLMAQNLSLSDGILAGLAIIACGVIGLLLIRFPNFGKKYDTRFNTVFTDPKSYESASKGLGYCIVAISLLGFIVLLTKVISRF